MASLKLPIIVVYVTFIWLTNRKNQVRVYKLIEIIVIFCSSGESERKNAL
jgi:hypothetical protein